MSQVRKCYNENCENILLDRETYEKMKGGENDAERKTD